MEGSSGAFLVPACFRSFVGTSSKQRYIFVFSVSEVTAAVGVVFEDGDGL
jgi:hypothetical protein